MLRRSPRRGPLAGVRSAPLRPSRPRLESLEARDVPTFFGNQVFPLDNPWNQVISAAPVAANSDAIITRIVNRHSGTAPKLHADFSNPLDGALYGIPINVVDGTVTPKVNVVVTAYASESDVVPVPIPANAVIEGDGPTGPNPPSQRGDSHMLVYDKAANVVFELGGAVRPNETSFPDGSPHPVGQWGAGAEAVWDLNKNTFRTVGWTSVDAAGLPIMPGLVRPDEALPASAGGQGAIKHAIRMTVQQTANMFVYPASHKASSLSGSDLPRMGERFRLKASFVIPSTWSPEAKAIAQAMKDYGMIVADNGGDMFFTGMPSDQWNMSSVLQVQQITAANFEVVNLTPVVTGLSAASGSTGGGTSVTVTGSNFSGAAGQLHVLFGGVEASSVTVLSDSQVVAVAPAHAAGTVDVQVRSGTTKINSGGASVFFGYGTSAAVTADQFSFTTTSPPPPANTPPTISGVPDESVPAGQPTGAIPFTVGDAQTPAGSLAVSAGSSNPALVPAAAIALGGSGSSRTVSVTPAAGQSGTATITLTVTDAGGMTASDAFVLTVTVPPPPPPPPPPPSGRPFAVGTDGGRAARVTMYNPDGTVRFTALPFGAAYTGGVRVAVGDVTGDGVPDVVAGTGGGTPAQVRVVDGATGSVRSWQLLGTTSYTGPASVAAGDVTGDGVADVAVGTDESGPRARVFRGGDFAKLADFRAGGKQRFRGQTQVALADLTGDGVADLVVSGLYPSGPVVSGFDGNSLRPGASPVSIFGSFTAPGSNFAGGLFLAVGDVTGDGFADLVLGSGAGAAPEAMVYSGRPLVQSNTLVKVADFVPAGAGSASGVRVGVRDVDGDGVADILTASGEMVTAFRGGSLPPTGPLSQLWSFDPDPSASYPVRVG